MSDDLAPIHEQTSAILEKLYDEKGQPDDLDDAFVQEYFKLVQNHLNLDVEEDAIPFPKGPHRAHARLSQADRSLIDVHIPSMAEKFVASQLSAVRTLFGTSQRFGSSRGTGMYLMTTVRGIPNITIKSGTSIDTFIGFPNSVRSESGRGRWERV